MTKTEYTAAITANQTAISTLRTDLRKLRTIEKLSKSFPDLKLVDASILEASITAKKAEVQKLRAELSKARRIVKRMTEIEDIETGKTGTPKSKSKKSAAPKNASGATAKKSTEKKNDSKDVPTSKQAGKREASGIEKPTASTESTGSPAA